MHHPKFCPPPKNQWKNCLPRDYKLQKKNHMIISMDKYVIEIGKLKDTTHRYKPTQNSDISYYILWNHYPKRCLNSFDGRTLTNFSGDFLIKFHSLILSIIP